MKGIVPWGRYEKGHSATGWYSGRPRTVANYLLGVRVAHSALFDGSACSAASVADETRARAKFECDLCALRPACCPNAPARKILRSIHDGARDMARDIARTADYVASRRQRKKIEMLFAHLKRILKLDRLRLRGPNGGGAEFHLAAAAQNLRKLAKLVPMPTPAMA